MPNGQETPQEATYTPLYFRDQWYFAEETDINKLFPSATQEEKQILVDSYPVWALQRLSTLPFEDSGALRGVRNRYIKERDFIYSDLLYPEKGISEKESKLIDEFFPAPYFDDIHRNFVKYTMTPKARRDFFSGVFERSPLPAILYPDLEESKYFFKSFPNQGTPEIRKAVVNAWFEPQVQKFQREMLDSHILNLTSPQKGWEWGNSISNDPQYVEDRLFTIMPMAPSVYGHSREEYASYLKAKKKKRKQERSVWSAVKRGGDTLAAPFKSEQADRALGPLAIVAGVATGQPALVASGVAKMGSDVVSDKQEKKEEKKFEKESAQINEELRQEQKRIERETGITFPAEKKLEDLPVSIQNEIMGEKTPGEPPTPPAQPPITPPVAPPITPSAVPGVTTPGAPSAAPGSTGGTLYEQKKKEYGQNYVANGITPKAGIVDPITGQPVYSQDQIRQAYERAQEQYQKYYEEAQNVQQPFYQAGLETIPGYKEFIAQQQKAGTASEQQAMQSALNQENWLRKLLGLQDISFLDFTKQWQDYQNYSNLLQQEGTNALQNLTGTTGGYQDWIKSLQAQQQQSLAGLSQQAGAYQDWLGKFPGMEQEAVTERDLQRQLRGETLGGIKGTLEGMRDPAAFVNNLLGKYQESPYAKHQQQQALLAAQNMASAIGLQGSTPMMQFAAQQARDISSQDMNQWLQNALGVNTQYLGQMGNLYQQQQGQYNVENALRNLLTQQQGAGTQNQQDLYRNLYGLQTGIIPQGLGQIGNFYQNLYSSGRQLAGQAKGTISDLLRNIYGGQASQYGTGTADLSRFYGTMGLGQQQRAGGFLQNLLGLGSEAASNLMQFMLPQSQQMGESEAQKYLGPLSQQNWLYNQQQQATQSRYNQAMQNLQQQRMMKTAGRQQTQSDMFNLFGSLLGGWMGGRQSPQPQPKPFK